MRTWRIFYTSARGADYEYSDGRVRVHLRSGWSKSMKATEFLRHLQKSTAGPNARQIEQKLRAVMAPKATIAKTYRVIPLTEGMMEVATAWLKNAGVLPK